MTAIHSIIKDGYRESNLLPITQNPTLDEQNEALALLNRFIWSVFGNEAGERLRAFQIGTSGIVTTQALPIYPYTDPDFIPLNARLMVNIAAPTTVHLHPDPEDGARIGVVDNLGNLATHNLTLHGNGKKIEGAASLVLNTNNLVREWFYRADIGNWQRITELGLNDPFPFPLEFEDMFIIGLATRLNPRNGVAIDEQAMMNFRRQRNIFRARYAQTIQTQSEEGLLRMTGTRGTRQFVQGSNG